MYTQCDHCKAIFEVSMREVTVAAGQLRCGECNEVFDAMESLSTTLPEPFSGISDAKTSAETTSPDTHQANHHLSKGNDSHIDKNDKNPRVIPETITTNVRPEIKQADFKYKVKNINKHLDSKWLKIITLSLATLLLAQVLYNNRHYFSNAPKHAPEQIEMISNNVFAHPNEEGVLLISASMENHANHSQPFPVLEVSLTDANAKLVALRRFKPEEYLDNYHKEQLLEVNKPINLNLKIKDPGDDATRFQFKFL